MHVHYAMLRADNAVIMIYGMLVVIKEFSVE